LTGAVIGTAKELFTLLFRASNCKVHRTEVVVFACLFLACRCCRVNRTYDELLSVTDLDGKLIKRAAQKIQLMPFFKQFKQSLNTAEKLIDRFCAMLNLPLVCNVIRLVMIRTHRSWLHARAPGCCSTSPTRCTTSCALHRKRTSLLAGIQRQLSVVPSFLRHSCLSLMLALSLPLARCAAKRPSLFER